MKIIRLVLIFLTILSLLSATKLERRKKIGGGLVTGLNTAATATGLIADQANISANKQTKAIMLNKISNVEQIRQVFLNSLLSICSHAINASSLNAGLFFHLRASFAKLKARLGQKTELTVPSEEDKSLTEIIEDAQKAAEDHKKSPQTENEGEMKKALEHHYSSNLLRDLQLMEEQLSKILAEDEKTKEEICFGKESLTELEKSKQKAFEKLEEVTKKLNETKDFIELLNPLSSEVKEQQQTSIEKEVSQLPEDQEKLQTILKSKPYWLRALKGCYSLFRFILPFVSPDLDKALSIGEQLLDFKNIKSSKDFFAKSWTMLKNLKVMPLVFETVKKVIGSVFDYYSPLKAIFSNVKQIINSKREVANLKKQTKQEINALKHDATKRINMKTLEVMKVSYDSLFNFKILKLFVSTSLKLESKDFRKPKGKVDLKEICKANFFLCKLEHGLKFIEEHFKGEKVCAKDIFIAGSKDNEELLTEHRFVPLKKNSSKLDKFAIYWNFFFSVARKSVLRIIISDKTDLDKVKDNFLKRVRGEPKYSKEECEDKLESKISVDKLNSKDDNIYVVRAENDFIAECKVLNSVFCVDLVKLLQSKDFSSLRRSADDLSSSSSPRHRKSLAENNRELLRHSISDLDTLFMKNICELVKKRVGFTEEEEERAKALIGQVIPQSKQHEIEDKATIARSTVKTLVALKNVNEFKMNVLDAILVKYNKIVDRVQFQKDDKSDKILTSFKFKEFEPRDIFALMNFYSSGHKSCLKQDIIKKRIPNDNSKSQSIVKENSETKFFKEILETSIDKDILKKVKKEDLSYYFDFLSRYQNHLHSFEIPFKQDGLFSTGKLINKDITYFKYDLKTSNKVLHIDDVSDCKFTFQFAQLELKDEGEGSFKVEASYKDKEFGFPILNFKRAESEDIGFENKLFVLFYLVNDSVAENDEISHLYEGISSKLAKFNYFPLISKLSFAKNAVEVEKPNPWIGSTYAKLYTEVFVKPKKHKFEAEGISVCNKFAAK